MVFIVLNDAKPAQSQTPKQKRKQDALELAELIYDMFTRPDKIEEEEQE